MITVDGGPGADRGVDVVVDDDADAAGWRWRVANTGASPVAVRSVARTLDLPPVVRLLRNGWQSWSASDVVDPALAVDPSRGGDHPSLVRWCHHADPDVVAPGEVRSAAVTVVELADGTTRTLGAVGGARHDTTFRLRGGQLAVEAWLGGAALAPGEVRELHPIGEFAGLGAWADAVGRVERARTSAPFQVGWCSWYQYFHEVTEAAIRADLATAAREGWPFDVFQVDDGFQAAIGDWLHTNERFPSPLAELARAIAEEGRTPGLWIAPFVAAPESDLARTHPDWLVPVAGRDRRLVATTNPAWGGEVHVLDTTRPDVLAHLEDLGRSLRDAGFPYLKLDFTYAPALPGTFADPGRTPAERVRLGYEAIRRGAGDDAFLLACGVPLTAVVGVVDGCRIGPDVAPWWAPSGTPAFGPYGVTQPSTEAAWRAVGLRQPLHRRLWLNDPDCLLLRDDGSGIPEPHRTAWALAVGASGGMALVSDELARCSAAARALLQDVVAAGRAADLVAGGASHTTPPEAPG